MSHEGVLYCKPHHRELFQPKVVVREHDEPANTRTQEAIGTYAGSVKYVPRLRKDVPGPWWKSSGQHACLLQTIRVRIPLKPTFLKKKKNTKKSNLIK